MDETTNELENPVPSEKKSFFETFLKGVARDIPEAEWARMAQRKTIFEELAATFDELPDEMLAKLPTDGAENHDHYLYGAPKKSAS